MILLPTLQIIFSVLLLLSVNITSPLPDSAQEFITRNKEELEKRLSLDNENGKEEKSEEVTSVSEKSEEKSNEEKSSPTVTLAPAKGVGRMITAKSTIEDSGIKLFLTIQYPSGGGPITGTITGDCKGNASGNYSGPATGNFQGSANTTCKVGFFSIPVEVTYQGKLEGDKTTAFINYTATGAGRSDSGTTILELD